MSTLPSSWNHVPLQPINQQPQAHLGMQLGPAPEQRSGRFLKKKSNQASLAACGVGAGMLGASQAKAVAAVVPPPILIGGGAALMVLGGLVQAAKRLRGSGSDNTVCCYVNTNPANNDCGDCGDCGDCCGDCGGLDFSC